MTTRELMQALLLALQKRRAAWISVRPDVLAPSPDVEQLSLQLAHEENQRAGLLARIRAALPSPAGDDGNTHVNVTRITAAMPAERGRALRRIADEVTRLAKLVRTEVTLGQRLLRFAQSAQAEMTPELAAVAGGRGAVPGYDRRARSVAQAGSAGRLIDGRM
jgi:hypothetical protein